MTGSRLACQDCGTQFHGRRDVCPFCHHCIHQRGGMVCRQCGQYIETVAEARARERQLRADLADAAAEMPSDAEIDALAADICMPAAILREVVERNLRRTITALPTPTAYTHASAVQHG